MKGRYEQDKNGVIWYYVCGDKLAVGVPGEFGDKDDVNNMLEHVNRKLKMHDLLEQLIRE